MDIESRYVLQDENDITKSVKQDVIAQNKVLETEGAFRHRRIGQRIVTTYMYFLNELPVLTKCITSAIISGIGDLSAQYTEYSLNAVSSEVYYPFQVDFMRQLGIITEASFVSGPIMHYAFDILEVWFPVHGEYTAEDLEKSKMNVAVRRWCAALTHLLFDTLILCPLFVLTIMVFTSLAEGEVKNLAYEVRYNFAGTYYIATLASLVFAPLQLLAFRILPINLRLLYMNVQDIFWNAIVSFMTHRSRH